MVIGANVGRWDIAVAIQAIKSCGRSTRIVVAADGPIGPEKVLRVGADVFMIKDDEGAARVLAALMG
ncbi:MAG TPA: hypothetical protein VF429_08330 [Anaerolineae bacterium]